MQNRAAEANVVQTRSTAAQADYKTQDTARNIASAVIVAAEGVRNAILQRQETDRSVAFFRTALDNEREKYRLGIGSLVEVLTVEDRLHHSSRRSGAGRSRLRHRHRPHAPGHGLSRLPG